ncbi:MAG: DUF2029 domain-containing protein [Candidatus Pacebacteria bacterium]|nr:DUF2029 domain-containing protein [Candidatus Paceibacterota bacterium]
MSKNYQNLKLKFLFFLAVLLQLSYLLFALFQQPYFYFFPHGNVHEFQGMDFYQVPNGAHAFFQGGSLNGVIPTGGSGYSFGNYNVYHPFFTVVVGGFLQLFQPETAFLLWKFLNPLIKLILIWLVYKKVVLASKSNQLKKTAVFALFIFLANFAQALEMWNGQYHFLLDTGIVLFFLFYKHDFWAALALVLTFLVKPVTVLWLPFLLVEKRFRLVALSVAIFTAVSVPFLLNGSGDYYFTNLITRIGQPIGGPPGVFTLDALLRTWQVSWYLKYGLYLKVFLLVGILFLQWKKQLSFWKVAFLLTSFYLLFYDLVFEYHYTTLGTLLALGFLSEKVFQQKIVRLLALSSILMTPYIFMYIMQLGTLGHYVTKVGWSILVLSKIVPLMLLNFYLVKSNDKKTSLKTSN